MSVQRGHLTSDANTKINHKNKTTDVIKSTRTETLRITTQPRYPSGFFSNSSCKAYFYFLNFVSFHFILQCTWPWLYCVYNEYKCKTPAFTLHSTMFTVCTMSYAAIYSERLTEIEIYLSLNIPNRHQFFTANTTYQQDKHPTLILLSVNLKSPLILCFTWGM